MLSSHSFILFCAAAATLPAATFTPERAAVRALAHNPALSAARLRVEEARGRLDGAGRWANPEIEFEYRQNPQMPEWSFALAWMQKFPLTARLRLEKAVSRAELAAAEGEVRDAERRLAGTVRESAVKVLALRRQRELRRQQLVNSKELAEFTTRRVSVGEAAAVDAAQVELEATQIATEMHRLDAQRAVLLGELRLLLGLGADEDVEIAGELGDPDAASARRASHGDRGDYRAAQATAEAAREAARLARARNWEDIGVGLSAEHARTEDAPDGFDRDTMLGLKLSVPLPIWNRNEGAIRQAAATAQRREREVQALAAQIAAETATARSEMTALARVIADFDEKLLPQSRRIEEQLRSSYSTGQTTLPEVIRARGRRFELEAQRLDALRDYHLARARHHTALGLHP
jgi:outer membrane protein TolC